MSSYLGGEYLLITGDGFGDFSADDYHAVSINGKEVRYTSYANNLIIVRLPPLSHGTHAVNIYIDNYGFVTYRCMT